VTTTVFVYTMSRTGEVGAWSRYKFPFHVDNFCQMGNHLYIRAGDDVLMVDEIAATDFEDDDRAQPFTGVVQWPWLDLGQPGVSKQIAGFDLATIGAANVGLEVGYDQSNKTAFTDLYTIPGDTLPGTFIPMPVLAPSFSIRLTFSSFDFWQFQAMTVYLVDDRITA
jgi:hypothetical protein